MLLRHGDSAQRSVYKSLQTSQRKNSTAATLSWSIKYDATWFTLELHRAPLALDTYMLVYFRILWHKLVIVWLLVPTALVL